MGSDLAIDSHQLLAQSILLLMKSYSVCKYILDRLLQKILRVIVRFGFKRMTDILRMEKYRNTFEPSF